MAHLVSVPLRIIRDHSETPTTLSARTTVSNARSSRLAPSLLLSCSFFPFYSGSRSTFWPAFVLPWGAAWLPSPPPLPLMRSNCELRRYPIMYICNNYDAYTIRRTSDRPINYALQRTFTPNPPPHRLLNAHRHVALTEAPGASYHMPTVISPILHVSDPLYLLGCEQSFPCRSRM